MSGVRIAAETSVPSMTTRLPSTSITADRATRHHGLLVVEIDAQLRGAPRHGAIHGAGVDVAVAERRGDRARHGSLSHSRGSVDGDDVDASGAGDWGYRGLGPGDKITCTSP